MDTEQYKITARSSLDELGRIREFIAGAAQDLQVDSSVMENLQIAADEAVTNIIKHGYKSEDGEIEIRFYLNENQCTVSIRDSAEFFDLKTASENDLNVSPLDQEMPGGYGISLMRRLTDEIKQKKMDNGQNELLLIKSL